MVVFQMGNKHRRFCAWELWACCGGGGGGGPGYDMSESRFISKYIESGSQVGVGCPEPIKD